jgi:hypothetical protein
MPLWKPIEAEMKRRGYDLDRIPNEEQEQHLWADGLTLFWSRNKRLPNMEELCREMLEEWNDPVGIDEAEHVLTLLKGG